MRFKAAPAKKNDTQVAEDDQGMKRPRLTISGMMVVVASVARGIAAYVALDRWTAMPWAGPSRDMPLAFRIVDDATGKTYRGCQTAGSGPGRPQGIAPLGLPQIRTCPLGHTARHVMSSLRGGTLSGSQPVVEADTAPARGRIGPREWSRDGDAARAISSRYRSQTSGIGTEQRSCL